MTDKAQREMLAKLPPELQDPASLLSITIEQAHEGMAMVNLDGDILYTNRAFAHMHGYAPDEIMGKNLSIFHTEAQMAEVTAANNQVKETGEFDGCIWHKRRDGTQFLGAMHNSLLRDAKEVPFGLIGTLSDATDHERIHTALRESEYHYRQLVETIPQAMCVVQDDTIAFANPATTVMLGANHVSDVLGHSATSILGDVDQERLDVLRESAAHDPDAFPGTYTVMLKRVDGSTFPAELVVTQITYHDRPAIQVLATDISMRREATQALLTSEGRYRSIVEESPMGMHMYALDANDQLVFTGANPAADRLLGVDNGQFIGKTIEAAFPPLAGTEVPERYRAAARDGDLWTTEQIEYKDQQIKGAYEVRAFQTGPGRMVAVFMDITRRKQAAQALRKSEATLHAVFRAAPTGIGIVHHRVLQMVNERICEMTGYTQEELQGKDARALYPLEEEFLRVEREQSREMSQHGTGTLLTQWRRKNGNLIHVLLSSTPLDTTQPKEEVIFTALDVTEQVHAREALETAHNELESRVRERTAQLQAANQELEAFVYSVSHDLRSPLRSIDGFSLALMEDCQDRLNDEGKDYLSRVRAATQHMGELIDGLLELSRASRGSLRDEAVDLSATVREIRERLAEMEPERTCRFNIKRSVTAQGDPYLLRVVLVNLLENAWKFTALRSDATIEFGVRQASDPAVVVYFVRDNGVGFDMKFVSKVFMPFQRLHASEKFSGTGVGLATVQRIVHRHGGRIWAEAEPDQGATFCFTLGRQWVKEARR